MFVVIQYGNLPRALSIELKIQNMGLKSNKNITGVF